MNFNFTIPSCLRASHPHTCTHTSAAMQFFKSTAVSILAFAATTSSLPYGCKNMGQNCNANTDCSGTIIRNRSTFLDHFRPVGVELHGMGLSLSMGLRISMTTSTLVLTPTFSIPPPPTPAPANLGFPNLLPNPSNTIIP